MKILKKYSVIMYNVGHNVSWVSILLKSLIQFNTFTNLSIRKAFKIEMKLDFDLTNFWIFNFFHTLKNEGRSIFWQLRNPKQMKEIFKLTRTKISRLGLSSNFELKRFYYIPYRTDFWNFRKAMLRKRLR